MSRRPRESESESEAEAEAEAPLRLDEPLAEEGLQDIDFDFDDPQERHAPSILGLLRKHPLADVAPRPALAALADLLAGDPRSVGTVVGSGGGDDLIGFVAAVDLAAYDAGAHAGVDAARACLGALAAGAARPVLVTHAFFVNTPPKVVAAAFQCFAADLDAAAFEADALVVPVRAHRAASFDRVGGRARSGPSFWWVRCRSGAPPLHAHHSGSGCRSGGGCGFVGGGSCNGYARDF